MHLRLVIPSVACVIAALLSGCATKMETPTADFTPGTGDSGRIILDCLVSYGAVPRTTNGLRQLTTPWSYAPYKQGVILQLGRADYPPLAELLHATLGTGKPASALTNELGKFQSVPISPRGGSVRYGQTTSNTVVIIARPYVKPPARYNQALDGSNPMWDRMDKAKDRDFR